MTFQEVAAEFALRTCGCTAQMSDDGSVFTVHTCALHPLKVSHGKYLRDDAAARGEVFFDPNEVI